MAFKARDDRVFLDVKGIQREISLLGIAKRSTLKEVVGLHNQLAAKLKVRAEHHFKQQIEHEELSATLGGEVYGVGGTRQRQTGRFFGPRARAFKTTRETRSGGAVQVMGWPDVEYADRVTRGVWRYLEFGLPSSKHRMPRFFWTLGPDPKSGRVAASYDRFNDFPQPGSRAVIRGPGFQGKFFLTDAWFDIAADIPEGYRDIISRTYHNWSQGRGGVGNSTRGFFGT